MSKTIVLNSFEGLREALNDTPTGEVLADTPVPCAGESGNQVLASLRTELECAAATLACIAQRDREARLQALTALEHYDRLVADLHEGSTALSIAQRLRKQAEALAAHALEPEDKQAAAEAADVPRRIEADASALVERLRADLTSMRESLDIERLLSERQRLQAAENARAARAERAQRLADALAYAQAALERERFEEARAVLGLVANENPGNAEIASLQETIAQRELEVKVALAEEALWLASRDYRFEPAAAVDRLAQIDTSALPEVLARQVFGAWASACLQLCCRRGLHDPVRFGAGPGRGVAFARETPGAPHVVVSAIGMRERWDVGAVAPEGFIQRALPLRRS